MPKIKFLFITDSWKSLDHPRDTTLRLMEEALKQKVEVYWACYRNVSLVKATPTVIAHQLLKVRSPLRISEDFDFSEKIHQAAAQFDQIHYRVDPPVDAHYENPLKILCFDDRVAKKVVNPPHLLLICSEKLDGLRFSKYSPDTLVSANERELLSFVEKHGKVILKPISSAQSKGVSIVTPSSFSKVKRATQLFDTSVVLQEFMPEISSGETRLWFLDGKLLAAVKKVPKKKQLIINMDRGGTLKKHSLNSSEKDAAKKIGAQLKKTKVRLAAIDLIGAKITDYNITSPGLIVQIEKLLKLNLAEKIIRALIK